MAEIIKFPYPGMPCNGLCLLTACRHNFSRGCLLPLEFWRECKKDGAFRFFDDTTQKEYNP